MALCLVLSVMAAVTPPRRQLFVTISTLNGTSPTFECPAAASLRYAPTAALAASLRRSATTAECQLIGAAAAGEYVVAVAAGDELVIKAIDLAQPVVNLGGQQVFTDSWSAEVLTDADAVADAWSVLPSAATSPCSATITGTGKSKVLRLGVAVPHTTFNCGLVGVPHEARTFNPFRAPVAVVVDSISISVSSTAAAAAARIALEVPSATAMNATSWPTVRHYLPLVAVNSSRDGHAAALPTAAAELQPASLAAVIDSTGRAQLLRRRTASGSTLVLQEAQLPPGCGTTAARPVRVTLFAGSVYTHGPVRPAPPLGAGLLVECEGKVVANLTSSLGLDWMDEDGFGESVGEAVLALTAVGTTPSSSASTPSASTITFGRLSVTNMLPPKSAPAVLAPITDQIGTINWDHGSLGSFHSVRGPPFGPEEGVLDVTMPPFNADGTGKVDATRQLQAAIDFSRHNYLEVWVPAGQYIITDSLNLTQYPRMTSGGFAQFNGSSNYCWSRFSTFKVQGEAAVPDARLGVMTFPRIGRATLVVPPNTPAFALLSTDPNGTAPRAVLNASLINSRGGLQPNILMSVIVQSIDVVIGAGNPAAVGARYV